ncbi:S8 family peptidase [Streptomyces griseoluteus]|uniref:S8 family peptidase n=1 Tax=Streptomyces griseoluteus TaxID=29306 RepID=UPI00381A8B89
MAAGVSVLLIATAQPSSGAGVGAPVASWTNAPRTAPELPETDGARLRWVPLITGDRVAVNAKGEAVSVRRAEGRENIAIDVQSLDGHTYAVPADAEHLIAAGRLDRRLFDVAALASPDYAQRPGLRLIVRYDAAHRASGTVLRGSSAAKVGRTLPSLNAVAVTAAADGTAELWSALTEKRDGSVDRTTAPGVASVWLDGVVKASLDVSVPQIGGPQAWAAGYDGKGTRIAVLDSGVDTSHPDLADQVVDARNFSASPDAQDRYGHGTHVASIAAGTGAKSDGRFKGVAPGARILSGKVLDDRGRGSESGVIAGIEWAAAQHANVVNLSLGSLDSPGVDPMEAAIAEESAETKTLFVVAAGNDGTQGPQSLASPGTADAALTVGAVDKQDHLAAFSSTGPRVEDYAVKPDLTAPGVAIGAAAAEGSVMAAQGKPVADGYVALDGTSMATPHVAGAAAILAQEHPDWNGQDIKEALVASTTPGAYSAYEQGSGRVDLGNAIKQVVVASQPSLSYGLAQWPHTDAQPVSKTLTYRNLGAVPLTLALSVSATGPDGSAAPREMFSVDRNSVTVPAHGESAVTVTADSRFGGDLSGSFTGRVSAVGAGQHVNTSVAVEREDERYTVTVKPVGRDGKPTTQWEAYLVGRSGAQVNRTLSLGGDSYSARVSPGRYFLNSSIFNDPSHLPSKGLDWFNQPSLVVDHDMTVTVDARTAKSLDITVPERSAAQTFGFVSAMAETPGLSYAAFSLFANSFDGLRTGSLGSAIPDADTFKQKLSASFSTGPQGHDEYHLIFRPEGDRFMSGFVHHARSSEFADVTEKLGAVAGHKTGAITVSTDDGAGAGTDYPLPHTGTMHLFSAVGRANWDMEFQEFTPTSLESTYYVPTRSFAPGRSYEQVFNVGVFGPDLPKGAGFFRADEIMTGSLPLLSDGAGAYNDNHGVEQNEPYDTTLTNVYRDGTLVSSSIYAMDYFYIAPEERSDYRVEVLLDRRSKADVTTSMSATWTFSSEYAPGRVDLPISVVRFTPKLDLYNSMRARASVQVPVTVKGAAAGRNLGELTVEMSADRGAHWKRLAVHDGTVRVVNPAAGGSVSFRAKASDKQGNAVEQTLIDAYRTK